MNKTEYLNFVEGQFEKCFKEKGYIQEPAVKITSRIDPSVDFIGSSVSTLKKYIFSDDIGKYGRFCIQNSIKLRSLKNLRTLVTNKFGSYYKNMGLLAKPNIEKVVFDAFDYLTNPKYLGLSSEDIHIRISSKDKDLMEAIKNVDKNIVREIDTENAKYTHKYGLDESGIFGRDFNIAVRKKGTEEFLNIGTIVAMESSEKVYAIDMGIGNTALSMCEFATSSSVASSRMADIYDINSIESIKLADAIMVVSILQMEKIRDIPSKQFKYKFNLFNHAIAYWSDILEKSDKEILKLMDLFISLEYKKSDFKSENTWKTLKFKR